VSKFLETSSLNENNLLYECKVLWNKFAKEIESSVFKGFGIVCECEIHGRRMV
jgi:hypothetical protein